MSDVLPAERSPTTVARESAAALLTVLGCVLLGAPVGLLWGHLTPRIQITAAPETGVQLPQTADFFAADAWFLGFALAAGLLTGVLAVTLGRRHGPACVLGLALGGLLGAEVARRTGSLVGLEQAEAFLRTGQAGTFELSVRLRSMTALAAWPLAALLAHGLTTAWRLPAAGE